MFDVEAILKMHQATVAKWHHEEISNPYENVLAIACQQHQFNYELWHQEDIARSPDVSDAEIAQVKRAIDKLNQQRNDWIEKLDDWLTEALEQSGVSTPANARLNTETPGSAVDRLSIMALRIYHLDEQLQRDDVDPSHVEKVTHRLAMCKLQRDELANSLKELLADILSGVRRHRTYRQFKMYNDPSLNPYLYDRDNTRLEKASA